MKKEELKSPLIDFQNETAIKEKHFQDEQVCCFSNFSYFKFL
jgi:hypothetical protein